MRFKGREKGRRNSQRLRVGWDFESFRGVSDDDPAAVPPSQFVELVNAESGYKVKPRPGLARETSVDPLDDKVMGMWDLESYISTAAPTPSELTGLYAVQFVRGLEVAQAAWPVMFCPAFTDAEKIGALTSFSPESPYSPGDGSAACWSTGTYMYTAIPYVLGGLAVYKFSAPTGAEVSPPTISDVTLVWSGGPDCGGETWAAWGQACLDSAGVAYVSFSAVDAFGVPQYSAILRVDTSDDSVTVEESRGPAGSPWPHLTLVARGEDVYGVGLVSSDKSYWGRTGVWGTILHRTTGGIWETLTDTDLANGAFGAVTGTVCDGVVYFGGVRRVTSPDARGGYVLSGKTFYGAIVSIDASHTVATARTLTANGLGLGEAPIVVGLVPDTAAKKMVYAYGGIIHTSYISPYPSAKFGVFDSATGSWTDGVGVPVVTPGTSISFVFSAFGLAGGSNGYVYCCAYVQTGAGAPVSLGIYRSDYADLTLPGVLIGTDSVTFEWGSYGWPVVKG